MLSPLRVAHRFIESEITFTNGPSQGSPGGSPRKPLNPKDEKPKEVPPRIKSLQRQKTFLDKKIEREQKLLQEKKAAQEIRYMNLPDSVQSALRKLKILPGRTLSITHDITSGKNVYSVLLRRDFEIVEDTVSRLNRLKTDPTFEGFDWTAKGPTISLIAKDPPQDLPEQPGVAPRP
jgi:hypothetical protein